MKFDFSTVFKRRFDIGENPQRAGKPLPGREIFAVSHTAAPLDGLLRTDQEFLTNFAGNILESHSLMLILYIIAIWQIS